MTWTTTWKIYLGHSWKQACLCLSQEYYYEQIVIVNNLYLCIIPEIYLIDWLIDWRSPLRFHKLFGLFLSEFIRAAAAASWEGILCNISADTLFHSACPPLIQGLWTPSADYNRKEQTHRSGNPSPVVWKEGLEGRQSLSRGKSIAWRGRGLGRTSWSIGTTPGAPPKVSPDAQKTGFGWTENGLGQDQHH